MPETPEAWATITGSGLLLWLVYRYVTEVWIPDAQAKSAASTKAEEQRQSQAAEKHRGEMEDYQSRRQTDETLRSSIVESASTMVAVAKTVESIKAGQESLSADHEEIKRAVKGEGP